MKCSRSRKGVFPQNHTPNLARSQEICARNSQYAGKNTRNINEDSTRNVGIQKRTPRAVTNSISAPCVKIGTKKCPTRIFVATK